jgi:hypothetical protein
MADLIVFRCPQTGMNVPTHLEKQQSREGRGFESFACPPVRGSISSTSPSGQPMSRDR